MSYKDLLVVLDSEAAAWGRIDLAAGLAELLRRILWGFIRFRPLKISGLPAWIAGFTDRGILREGLAADIIVYEQEKLGFLYDSPVYAADFPGGERRLIQKAKGHPLYRRQWGNYV